MMTRDDVMRLEGRELDAAVAKLVFGRRVVECDPVDGRYGPYTVREGHWTRVNGETYPLLDLVPEYSTDIVAAWEVVVELPWPIVLNNIVEGEWGCAVLCYGGGKTHDPDVIVSAHTVSEAICRAALLAALKCSEAKNGGDGA